MLHWRAPQKAHRRKRSVKVSDIFPNCWSQLDCCSWCAVLGRCLHRNSRHATEPRRRACLRWAWHEELCKGHKLGIWLTCKGCGSACGSALCISPGISFSQSKSRAASNAASGEIWYVCSVRSSGGRNNGRVGSRAGTTINGRSPPFRMKTASRTVRRVSGTAFSKMRNLWNLHGQVLII